MMDGDEENIASDYELLRMKNIAANNLYLSNLGFNTVLDKPTKQNRLKRVQMHQIFQPERQSRRIAQNEKSRSLIVNQKYDLFPNQITQISHIRWVPMD